MRYDPGLDVPVGAGVYGLGVTPDGSLALTANTSPEPSDGHASTGTGSVIRAAACPAEINHLGISDTPEPLAIALGGRHAAASIVRGASALQDGSDYTPAGAVALPIPICSADANRLLRALAYAAHAI